jgi:murein DD-endopeptidase MepM/ murein hydrolase activator NlpD
VKKFNLTGRWQWPLKNVDVSSHYGNRKHKFHQGVDFRANVGTPVLAANDGVVVYVGTKIRGYGRMVVLKHADNFYSVYAHHSKNLVKTGKRVARGEKIALSGKSGRASGPHLHFEIRQGTDSYNPVYAINENLKKFASNRNIASESTQ